jgi:hypothetical protein
MKPIYSTPPGNGPNGPTLLRLDTDSLIHLLNAVLGPRGPIISVEILNPFQQKDFADDKLTVLDRNARDQRGRLP